MANINVPELLAAMMRSKAAMREAPVLGSGMPGMPMMGRDALAARDLFQAGRRQYRLAKGANRDLLRFGGENLGPRELDAQLAMERNMAMAQDNPYWRQIQETDPVYIQDAVRDVSGKPTYAGYGVHGYDDYLEMLRSEAETIPPFDPMPVRDWQEQGYMKNMMFAGPKGALPAMALSPAIMAAMLRAQGQRSSAPPDMARGGF